MANICVVHHRIGYKKSPLQKNKLIIDEKVAYVVRHIFDMYYNEHGSKDILSYLTKMNILSPRGYQKTGIARDEELAKMYRWNETTILGILKNEVYIGNTVQNKTNVISYKIKKLRKVDKENYIRVNDTHDAIITKDVFDKVNCIIEKRSSNCKLKYDYLLRGLLICHHCKRRLQIALKSNSRKNAIKRPYITCTDHKTRGCYPLNMNYDKFEESILKVIKQICKIYVSRDDLYEVYENYDNKIVDLRQEMKKRVDGLNKNIREIDSNLESMYMDKLREILSEENYLKYSQKFIKQREELMMQKNELEEEINNEKVEKNTDVNLDELVDNFLKFDNIDKTFLYRIIDRIEIDKDKKVYLYFNFSKLNIISQNLNELIDMKELIRERN